MNLSKLTKNGMVVMALAPNVMSKGGDESCEDEIMIRLTRMGEAEGTEMWVCPEDEVTSTIIREIGNGVILFAEDEVSDGFSFEDIGIDHGARLTFVNISIEEELHNIQKDGCEFVKNEIKREWRLASYNPERCSEWFEKAINIIKRDRFDTLDLRGKLL